MRTVVSLSAVTAAFAASLGLSGCGGSSTNTESSGGTSSGGEANGGKTSVTSGGVSSGGASGGGAGSGGVSSGGASNRFPCSNPQPILDGDGKPLGLERCDKGGTHRVEPVECTVNLPPDQGCMGFGGPALDQCTKNADCSAAAYGRCSTQPQAGVCVCGYGCRTDADCGENGLCSCGGGSGYCLAATCRLDSDCAPGFECRSFQNPSSNLCHEQRFECQTAEDTCVDQTDCSNGDICVANERGEHHCRRFSCVVPGRPFLIDGCAVVAPVTERADWLELDTGEGTARVSPAAASALAAHYTRAAQLEHASIAAFARFALQLLELGAPAELVDGAQRAMADELSHTTLCFGLASRFAHKPLGPGRLPIDGCLEQTRLADVVRLAVREGCIGETVAAVQAGEAHAHARDTAVRRALSNIQRDETRHAELAFRFVRWALGVDPSLQTIVREELELAQEQLPTHDEDPRSEPSEGECLAYGLLPALHSLKLQRRVTNQVVAELLNAIVAEVSVRAA